MMSVSNNDSLYSNLELACTLIYSEHEAVLVDTPISIQQNRLLINWIEETAPNRKLSYIYITHGHPDHWVGIPQLLQRWPEAVPLATPGTIAHMKESVEPTAFARSWEAFFPGQIYQPFTFAQPLAPDGTFLLEDRWKMQAIECGHSDTHETTVLWVPDLRLAVCGDVVYGDCHQMLASANTRAKRDEWIRAVEKVEALDPLFVVPGHKRPGEMDGVWHLANTKKYIEDFGKLMATDPQTPKEIFQGITRMYPNRLNPLALLFSADGAFRVSREARI
jgi:glyoxylase-like metal-dependent hydrolase (beta-lactamase superfamily II)